MNKTAKIEYIQIPMGKVQRLMRYCKKYKKYGAWAEVEDCGKDKYNVVLYQPALFTDVFGNVAVKKQHYV